MKISRDEVVSKLPEWCDGVLIAPYAEGGEISDYLIFPIKKSRDEDSYYFSDKWRKIEIPYIIELFDLAPCILLRTGEIYRVRNIWGFGKYRHIELYKGDVESEV